MDRVGGCLVPSKNKDEHFDKDAETGTATDDEGVPNGWMGLDCGEERASSCIRKPLPLSQTIFWNGPPGVFTFEKFANGTKATMNAFCSVPIIVLILHSRSLQLDLTVPEWSSKDRDLLTG
jgi:3-phosphoglycerate kinase